MKTRRFVPDDAPAIERLNTRLNARGLRWPVYSEGPAEASTDPISSRLFVAASDKEVHGAVWLREHEFWMGGQPLRIGWAKYPVVESLINPVFNGVPGALILRLLREQPRLMALGMGGHGGAFAQLLRGMRWNSMTVPFYFMPVRPARVLRRLRFARRTVLRRAVLDALALSGLGWIGWKTVSLAQRITGPSAPRGYEAERAERFGSWADDVWERSRGEYGVLSRRDAAMLNAVFPPEMPVERLRVRRHGEDTGWACVLRRDLTEADDTAFGPLRVGLIADVLSTRADAPGVIAAATAYLRERDVDLLFSNQAHPVWGNALRAAGFLPAPSQFAFYWSPQMESALGPQATRDGFHVNRGDCDGPMFGNALGRTLIRSSAE